MFEDRQPQSGWRLMSGAATQMFFFLAVVLVILALFAGGLSAQTVFFGLARLGFSVYLALLIRDNWPLLALPLRVVTVALLTLLALVNVYSLFLERHHWTAWFAAMAG